MPTERRASSTRARAAHPSGRGAGLRPAAATGASLDLRRAPVQNRGHAAFERILDTTATLLEEVGVDRVTTNLIAERAGTNIATLYKYFPNKNAVLAALFRKQTEARNAASEPFLSSLGRVADWRQSVDDAIDAVARIRRSQPGNAALRNAMRSSPDLRELDVAGTERIAGVLATTLVRTGRLTPAQSQTVARCTLEITTSLLDLWNSVPKSEGERVLRELKTVAKAYLAPYLDPR
jgi:AcrR family transcriptional regulator